jgi:hypothetical protein
MLVRSPFQYFPLYLLLSYLFNNSSYLFSVFRIVDVPLWHRHHGERQAEALLVSDAVETSLGGWRFSLFLPVFYARERKTLPFGFSSIESSHYQDINTSPS